MTNKPEDDARFTVRLKKRNSRARPKEIKFVTDGELTIEHPLGKLIIHFSESWYTPKVPVIRIDVERFKDRDNIFDKGDYRRVYNGNLWDVPKSPDVDSKFEGLTPEQRARVLAEEQEARDSHVDNSDNEEEDADYEENDDPS